ncbi:MAG: hypothetical protein JXR91_16810 [Deltaproteobacteria bacterium]|nr:hypothetical protein [Deltaproteobacteria bacterium]
MLRAIGNKITTAGIVIISWFLATACSPDFESFNDVTKLRVLGISILPAELNGGEKGVIDALVIPGVKDGETLEVKYEWSWCPISSGSINSYDCLVTDKQLQDSLSFAGDGAGSLPPLDLGSEPTALFEYDMDPAVLKQLCLQIKSLAAPSFVVLPDCDRELNAIVKLKVSDGVDEVVAVKDLNLLLDENAVANNNPLLGEISAISPDDGKKILLDEKNPAELFEKTTYEIELDVKKESSEEFWTRDDQGEPVQKKESLFVTWFKSGGDAEYRRTGYIDGETQFEDINKNSWKTPKISDDGSTAYLYIVLQDERGGVTWITRQIELKERL